MTDRPDHRIRVGVCLSLSGRYARFGCQAARALEVWRELDGHADLVIEDDQSDPQALKQILPRVASGSDVLLSPYSTQLVRAAAAMVGVEGWLLWNHGGSGDDVESSHPGHVVSLLTPASRYPEEFIRRVLNGQDLELRIVSGKGSFGRQVAEGADQAAQRAGLRTRRLEHGGAGPPSAPSEPWALFSAGTFEQDVGTVRRAQDHPHPPATICAVAAGVREFAREVEHPDGIYGVGQWFPGAVANNPEIGPSEATFLTAYGGHAKTRIDYPGVQAVAGAALAVYCARRAGSTAPEGLWPEAAALDTETLFGGFKIDPVTGAQVKHQAVLVRWADGELGLS
ncbi:MAG TPA: ABC transporter substrate-binding protein [Streptosporangiaceae bacterium]|nr:ABC transporter substrate-binding protein [Streptosporangiaceae bacterium]